MKQNTVVLETKERNGMNKGGVFCPDLENWVITYQDRLLSLAFGILKDVQLAQDCVQEAFIKAGLKSEQLQNKNSVYSWLMKIVVNECRMVFRSKWLRNIIPTNHFPDKGKLDTYSFIEMSELYRLILDLPLKQRMVFLCFYYNDMSIHDISITLGMNESTCKTYLFRAKKRLSKMTGEIHENE